MKAGWTVCSRLRYVMTLALMAALCNSVPGYAGGFHLELAYCDVEAGPLTLAADNNIPLADGCAGQLIEHVSESDAISRPDLLGNPADGDLVLHGGLASRDNLSNISFRVNGTQRLGTAGFFLIDPAIEGHHAPLHSVYLRIWNAPDPAQATCYYETPLYLVNPRIQQMNFDRAQLAVYTVSGTMNTGPKNVPVPVEFNVLSSYPNPFNAEALLTYALEQPAHVTINVYDVQGRCAAQLVNANAAAGEHSLHFDGTGLPTGAYFAQLCVNGASVSTWRMMLLK